VLDPGSGRQPLPGPGRHRRDQRAGPLLTTGHGEGVAAPEMPKFCPSFCSPDGLATTLPEEVPSEVTIILLVVQGPRIVPCTPV
jgi:hypothetical protein